MKFNRIRPDEHIFTQRLADIADAPKSLCYMGKLPESDVPRVAIVGTRKPTRYGREVTERLASELARAGVVVISGLALGVDSIAQRAALEAGGTVIGVVPSELPAIAPRTNAKLAQDIIEQGGAMISEFGEGDGTIVGRWSFLERNRLVSGLSDAVVITEAAARSGTLNTAAHALTQGRDIFVVPGNITSPLSAGCNSLLRQGASPVLDVQDILEVIAPSRQEESRQKSLPIGDTPAEDAILKIIISGVRDGDQIQQLSGLSPAEFATSLTMLEINGVIKGLGANQWTLK